MNTLLILSLGAAAYAGATILLRSAHRYAEARNFSRARELSLRYRGRVVRHAPTGRVGRCITVGPCKHRILGHLRQRYMALIALDDECATKCLENPFQALARANDGTLIAARVTEVVAALPEEAAEFAK